MTGPIQDFSITDTNGKQCFFYTKKTPSGAPRAGTFCNEAGHINKGYFWHIRILCRHRRTFASCLLELPRHSCPNPSRLFQRQPITKKGTLLGCPPPFLGFVR